MERIPFFEAEQHTLCILLLKVALAELLFHSRNGSLVSEYLVFKPASYALNSGISRSSPLAYRFSGFVLEKQSGNKYAPTKHNSLAFGQEITQKNLHRGTPTYGSSSSVQSIKRRDTFLLA